eukprot:3070091-Rhodomonas_salina.1
MARDKAWTCSDGADCGFECTGVRTTLSTGNAVDVSDGLRIPTPHAVDELRTPHAVDGLQIPDPVDKLQLSHAVDRLCTLRSGALPATKSAAAALATM